MDEARHQAFLHDAIISVAAPVVVVSGRDGQLKARGGEGVFADDRRVLSRLVLLVDGEEPRPIQAHVADAATARFAGVLDQPDHDDPVLLVQRRRRAGDSLEHVVISNRGRRAARLRVAVSAAGDLAHVFEVKEGRSGHEVAAQPSRDGLRWAQPADGLEVALSADPRPDATSAGDGRLEWDAVVEPGGSWTLDLQLSVRPGANTTSATVAAPGGGVPWSLPRITCDDRRVQELVAVSLCDLGGLLLADPEDTGDPFLAAGAPWFLTLFGRDSLWAARMLLPLGTDLAAGTLRTLARRQGRRVDPATEEQPGKILHELRREATPPGGSISLPPLYYGTVDATPLFVSLLSEAWMWGMGQEEVEALLPAAERALGWMRDHGDADGDGFLEYVSSRPGGLANQGWKDSPDGVQYADGRLAEPPIALCEVQGYAYEAAVRGADLLEAFGRPGADDWREWAEKLAVRFRGRFWLEDADGPYVAVALDAEKHPADSVASNMGHLPGTGILNREECAHVARRLTAGGMSSGYGLRTMSTGAAGFNPLGYHSGSVWPHDTAVTAASLAAAGHQGDAVSLLAGLVDAAPWFGYRLPELYGGEQAGPGSAPLPYPHACAPQAWAAASSVVLIRCLLGLSPSAPAGRVDLSPLPRSPWGAIEVSGLRLAGAEFSVRVSADGAVDLLEGPAGLTVRTGSDNLAGRGPAGV